MPAKKIVLLGREVNVEEDRYAAFDSFAPVLAQALGAAPSLSARDSQEAMAFIVSQLAYTEAQTYEKLYTPMQYERLVPITNEAGEWAEQIRYEIYDFAGQGKRISGKGRDIPMVDVTWADTSWPVVQGAIGYDYTTEELRRSAYLRRPIPTAKLSAAIEAYQRHMNNNALYGESNFTGLFNNPFVPQGNAPNGLWSSTNSGNPALILQDLNAGMNNVWKATNFNDIPDTIAMSPTEYQFINETARSINSDTTIMEYFLKHNTLTQETGRTPTVVPGFGLDTAGAGGTPRAIYYVKSPNRLILHIPLPLRFLAPQLKDLSVVVPGEYKYSGLTFRYPKSAYYMDNV